MKLLTTNEKRNRRAFTLIEMIGVLAVIAILAAVLIPKVFEAINNARINNAAMSCNTVKTAVVDHYSKYGTLPVSGVTTPPTTLTVPQYRYDTNLVAESFLDKPFAVRIGDGVGATNNTANGTRVEMIAASTSATTAPTAAGDGSTADAAYDLDGSGNANDAVGSVVVEAVITGVTLNDARELDSRIDGADLSKESATGVDLIGRVKYNLGANATGTVLVYLTHR